MPTNCPTCRCLLGDLYQTSVIIYPRLSGDLEHLRLSEPCQVELEDARSKPAYQRADEKLRHHMSVAHGVEI